MKKGIALLMALCMVLCVGLIPVCAEEDAPMSILLNGEMLQDVKAVKRYGIGFVQFVPFAQRAGYTTTFDAENNRVHAIKGEREIVFEVNSIYRRSEYSIWESGQQVYTNAYMQSAFTLDGSSYVDSDFLAPAFGYQVDATAQLINLYDTAYYTDAFVKKTPAFSQYITDFSLPQDFTATLTGNGQLSGQFDAFGLNLHMDLALDATVRKSGDNMWVTLESNTGGLWNLMKLVNNLVSEEITYDMAPDRIELFLDAENAYIKISDMQVWQGEEIKEKMREAEADLAGKWLKIPRRSLYSTQYTGFNSNFDNLLSGTLPISQMPNAISDIMAFLFSDFTFSTPDENGSTYTARTAALDFFAALLGDAHFSYQEADGKKVASYQLDAADLLAADNGTFPPEARDYLSHLTAQLSYSDTTEANGQKTIQVQGDGKVQDIPNSLNAPDCAAEGNVDLTLTIDPVVELFEMPIHVISEEEFHTVLGLTEY